MLYYTVVLIKSLRFLVLLNQNFSKLNQKLLMEFPCKGWRHQRGKKNYKQNKF